MDEVYLVVIHDTVHVLNPISVYGPVKEDPLFIGGILCQKSVRSYGVACFRGINRVSEASSNDRARLYSLLLLRLLLVNADRVNFPDNNFALSRGNFIYVVRVDG